MSFNIQRHLSGFHCFNGELLFLSIANFCHHLVTKSEMLKTIAGPREIPVLSETLYRFYAISDAISDDLRLKFPLSLSVVFHFFAVSLLCVDYVSWRCIGRRTLSIRYMSFVYSLYVQKSASLCMGQLGCISHLSGLLSGTCKECICEVSSMYSICAVSC